MKRTAIIIVIVCQAVAALMARDVTVNIAGGDAREVFAELMRQTGKNFVYPAGLLDGIQVTVKAEKEPLDRVLDRMFAGTDIAYKMRGRNVMLMRKAQAEPAAVKITVSGFVREKGSGEALAGAVVRNRDGGAYTVTNANGFYSLTMPAGPAGLTVSCTGYQPRVDVATDMTSNRMADYYLAPAHELTELTVTESRNRVMTHESAEVGSLNLTRSTIKSTPVVMGESDVIKTLQLQPGVSAGIEGFAGMYVHGGNTDENLYMIDNIPLYQVNHMFGLFSAFNTEAMRNVDFYKSSFPAKYDGRLSSYMDMHTKDGSMESHHGSVTLGPMALALDVDGPIRKGRTTYAVAVRRTWADLLAMSLTSLVNSSSDDDDEKISSGFSFIDVNMKVNHKFSERSSGHIMVYYGDDYLKGGSELNIDSDAESASGTMSHNYHDKDMTTMRWGNLVASAGWKYVLSPRLYGEFTAAYTRYFSRMRTDWEVEEKYDGVITESSRDIVRSKNNIEDWIVRADMEWRPAEGHKVELGGGYTRHGFLPSRTTRQVITPDFNSVATDSAYRYHANELNAYAGDYWTVNDRLRINAGVHLSLFNIDGRTHAGVSPRVAVRYTPGRGWALKAAYSRAHQYVHQLSQSFISLPTDQWVPITGGFKPQRSDKVAAGVYRLIGSRYSLAVEGYWKWMHNLIDYRDEYYLIPPLQPWQTQLTAGKGTAKGVDVKLAKEAGKLSGHVSYSLMWADRTFADRNGGRTYPARFDNRHKINVALNWQASDKWEINAAWTGMSGNRCTLPTQMWVGPNGDEVPLVTDLNNYRLPFYHRLDLSFIRHTRRGYWTFSIFNAYSHVNVVTARRGTVYDDDKPWNEAERPVFEHLKLLPIIPTFSYTWKF